MSKHETRTMKVAVMREGASIFDEGVFFVEIADESGGEFLILTQNKFTGDTSSGIPIDQTEWPELRKAIDDMVKRCKK
jgi:hypothetical protein